MPASLRLELFVGEGQRCVDFYTNIMQFEVLRNEEGYIYMRRDKIFLAAIPKANEESVAETHAYRRPPKGIEIVIEVDDLAAERDRFVQKGWKLDDDIKLQEWGLRDFRVVDPDGYYVRITTHSPNRDSKGPSQ